MTTEGLATARLKHAAPLAQINVREQVGMWSVPVMIEAQIEPLAVGDDVPRRAVGYRDIVHETRAEVESDQQIVLASKYDSMVTGGLATGFDRAIRVELDTAQSDIRTADENAAVGVENSQVSRPAISHTAHRHRVVAKFRKMSSIRQIGELEAKPFDSHFLNTTGD